ncbi:monoheme cytochrome C [Pricia sp. S334]|uniref:Monoheme cytochrome C n=1 Tax=Pricia mediterranea TaxID=3076079 RepID=A0ABU3LCC2_9FLAO|nr:monoheme cytochrome C [Pricia sp. S334]MDT7830712.1 monoheme cytochrome C [Pricia sp. S334]
MENNQDKNRENLRMVRRLVVVIGSAFALIALVGIYLMADPELSLFNSYDSELTDVPQDSEAPENAEEDDWDKIENGVHVRTGFVDAPGMMETLQNCTNCHSAKLVIANRMNEERWIETIRWMQETQNLWDLGKNEEIIVDYLVTNYPPIDKGRRENLADIQWYELK